MEYNSQRAIWSLTRDQYVIIGKDCGLQLVDKNGNQIYGNALK